MILVDVLSENHIHQYCAGFKITKYVMYNHKSTIFVYILCENKIHQYLAGYKIMKSSAIKNLQYWCIFYILSDKKDQTGCCLHGTVTFPFFFNRLI